MDIVSVLVKDSRFWAAVLILVNAILYYFVPTFPKEIWAAIDGIAAVVIAVLAGQSANKTVKAQRAALGK